MMHQSADPTLLGILNPNGISSSSSSSSENDNLNELYTFIQPDQRRRRRR